MAVDTEHMALGIAGLRSQEYTKGTGRLHTIQTLPDGTVRHTWCCLGVLSDVAQRNGCQVTRVIREPSMYDYPPPDALAEFFGGKYDFLPREVMEWYGLTEDNPELTMGDGYAAEASAINDDGNEYGRRYSLAEIADAFERKYVNG